MCLIYFRQLLWDKAYHVLEVPISLPARHPHLLPWLPPCLPPAGSAQLTVERFSQQTDSSLYITIFIYLLGGCYLRSFIFVQNS